MTTAISVLTLWKRGKNEEKKNKAGPGTLYESCGNVRRDSDVTAFGAGRKNFHKKLDTHSEWNM